MSSNSGITSLYPPVIDDEEVRLQAQAKSDVMRRLNVSSTPLPAAPKPIMDSESLRSIYKPAVLAKTKDELHKEYMEREYGKPAMNKRLLQKIQKNKSAGKAEYEDFATHDIINAEVMRDEARSKLKAAAGKTDSAINKINPTINLNRLAKNKKIIAKPLQAPKNFNGLDGRMMIDPKHPDGFRYTHVNDLYRRYGDNPERYIQEVMYLYEDAPPPTAGVVKSYDNLDPSTYPMNQKNELDKYKQSFNNLNPQQQKIVSNQMRAKSAIGKRTLTKKEPEKLFENIFDKNGLRVSNKK